MELLSKAAERKGDKRSAAGNEQGNQKTPAMIQAVLQDALAKREEGVTPPRGGFTDVGLHTGGLPRNTSWPLVRAVLQSVLEPTFYRHAMAQMQLWLAEMDAHAVLEAASAADLASHRRSIDSCMQADRSASVQQLSVP